MAGGEGTECRACACRLAQAVKPTFVRLPKTRDVRVWLGALDTSVLSVDAKKISDRNSIDRRPFQVCVLNGSAAETHVLEYCIGQRNVLKRRLLQVHIVEDGTGHARVEECGSRMNRVPDLERGWLLHGLNSRVRWIAKPNVRAKLPVEAGLHSRP